jgi:hypothetical protein
LKEKKKTLLNHLLLKVVKQETQPNKSIEQFKKGAEVLKKNNASKYDELPNINISVNGIELNQLFQKVIVGNENSIIFALIKRLNNSNWIKKGLTSTFPKSLMIKVNYAHSAKNELSGKNLLRIFQVILAKLMSRCRENQEIPKKL